MVSSTGTPAYGRLIADRYRLEKAIGSGGMAAVWRAHDEHLDRDVAIKILNSQAQALQDPSSAAAEEARLAARLVHPNIVRVYDVGTDHGLQFVVMELVAGQPLNGAESGGPLEPARAAEIAAQIADALEIGRA